MNKINEICKDFKNLLLIENGTIVGKILNASFEKNTFYFDIRFVNKKIEKEYIKKSESELLEVIVKSLETKDKIMRKE